MDRKAADGFRSPATGQYHAGMRLCVIAFAAGILLVQRQPELPSWQWPLVLGSLLVLPAGLGRGALWRVLVFFGCLALGVGWAAWRAESRLANHLPGDLEGRDVIVSGVVANLPQPFAQGVRFEFAVNSALTADGQVATLPPRVMLSWYASRGRDEVAEVPSLQPGEVWQLTVRLRRPHGNANPGGFDYSIEV